MTEKLTSIADLPLDILVLIFPYLDATSFLALCSTCKGFQQPSIRLDSAYWSFATRSTFRVPNQPVVQYDGGRWEKMYRRLLTQSRVFTWGSSGQKRLGHSYNDPAMARFPPRRPGRIRINADCSVPTEMEDTRELGVIADMQCGCVVGVLFCGVSVS
jgi:SCF-associated factor 1